MRAVAPTGLLSLRLVPVRPSGADHSRLSVLLTSAIAAYRTGGTSSIITLLCYAPLDSTSSWACSLADASDAPTFGLGLALGLCVLSGKACTVLGISSSRRVLLRA